MTKRERNDFVSESIRSDRTTRRAYFLSDQEIELGPSLKQQNQNCISSSFCRLDEEVGRYLAILEANDKANM